MSDHTSSSMSGFHELSSTSLDARVGQVVDGRYRLLSVISKGSMGRVYAATQLQLDRRVAVKIMELNASLVDANNLALYQQRFLNEAGALAKLKSPHTVRIFDFGFWDGAPYLVMEYLEGRPLARVLREKQRISPLRAVRLAQQVCKSLAEAHSAGIVHRDLKPDNIVLLEDKEEHLDIVKIVDFGLVKSVGDEAELTVAGQIVGSPNYMAPELILESTDFDGRVDQYALGVTLFRIVSGRRPFPKENTVAVLTAHLNEIPPRLDTVVSDLQLPPILVDIVDRALQKDPSNRFANMVEMRRALMACEKALLVPDLFDLQMTVIEGRVEVPGDILSASRSLSVSMMAMAQKPKAVLTASAPPPVSPPVAPEATEEMPPQSGNGRWFVVGLAVLLLLGVGFLLWGSNGAPPDPTGPAQPSVLVAAEAPSAAPPSAEGGTAEVPPETTPAPSEPGPAALPPPVVSSATPPRTTPRPAPPPARPPAARTTPPTTSSPPPAEPASASAEPPPAASAPAEPAPPPPEPPPAPTTVPTMRMDDEIKDPFN